MSDGGVWRQARPPGRLCGVSVISRFARRVGGSRVFSWIGRAYVPLDRLLGRVSRGRFVALGQRDLPSLLITTTGRSTGKPRTNPLLYAPDGDGLVVIGSNWGQAHHPAWSSNLLAKPAATVVVRGEKFEVRARLVEGEERARLRGLLLKIWPGYATYETRAQGRTLRIFRLERT
jgi:deazaflavin-dependent oxidoreductase (nitroreductase family)